MILADNFHFEFYQKNIKMFKKMSDEGLDSLSIWTEICSYIKGFTSSYSYPNWHLPKEKYIEIVGAHKGTINIETKKKIWDFAQEYEKWKCDIKAFDLMDFVSYMINEIMNVNLII